MKSIPVLSPALYPLGYIISMVSSVVYYHTMSTVSEEYIKSILSQVATNMKLVKWHHKIRNFECIGQNYFGVIMPVTLSGYVEAGQSYDYQIVLKLAPTDERYRVSGAITTFFRREIFVYSVLLKKFQEIQINFKLTPLLVIPDIYFVRDEHCKEVIVMRDMSADGGYKPYTQKSYLDIDHVVIALKALARLHALSLILKEEDSQLYEEVKRICIPLTEASNKRYMDIMRDRLTKALCKFESTTYVPLLEKLKLHCGKFFDKAIELAEFTCICHGDVWKENILFSYHTEDKKPKEACLIDYQTTRLSSPAFDALYLIISSTDNNLRRDNYYKLLDIYYNTFNNCLVGHKESLNSIYSRESFDYDLKLVAPACLITANTALWLSNGLQEEGHVSSKHIWTIPEEKYAAVNKYKDVVSGIIDDFYTYGYLPEEVL